MRGFPPGTRTLRGRLIFAFGVAILGAVALFAGVTVAVASRELRGSLDDALRTRAQEVAQLAVSAPAVLSEPGALESAISGREIVVEVLDARGRIVARSLGLGARVLPLDRLTQAAIARGSTGYEDIRLGDRPLRLFAAPVARVGGPASGGAVLAAADTGDIAATTRDLQLLLAIGGLVVAAIAVAVAARLTRRGLRPLGRLAVAAGEIERTADPGRRLPDPGTADEVGQLTEVLNRMLDSLERARSAERRFLADASHELRTPVTALLGNVDYAARHGADSEVIADLQRDAARLARLVDDLLVLERAGSPGGAEPASVALHHLVRDLFAGRERVRLEQIEPAVVRADEGSLRRAIENLVENGLLHGPAGGEVTVTLHVAGGFASLSVRDEGPGPDPAHGEQPFERFWRAPEAAARPGSGLGLSIVAATARQLGGRVRMSGSAFTLELPLDAGG